MVQRASSSLPKSTSARGFTLVELLVVIAIIAILIGLAVVIASKVSGSGKQRQTEQTLRLLDSVLSAYTNAKGSIPPPTVLDPRFQAGNTKAIIPIVDGRNFSTGVPPGQKWESYINSVGLFLLQCKEVPEADAMLKGVDPKIIHDYDPDVQDPSANAPVLTQQPMLPTAFDGWGHPIRYVHPAFKGVIVVDPSTPTSPTFKTADQVLGVAPPGKQYRIMNIRRANSLFDRPPPPPGESDPGPYDADGGLPTGTTPYFYSCGPDNDPGTIEDNIYTTKPKLPKR